MMKMLLLLLLMLMLHFGAYLCLHTRCLRLSHVFLSPQVGHGVRLCARAAQGGLESKLTQWMVEERV